MSEFDFFKNMSIYGDTYGMTQEEIDADKENSDSTDSDSTGIGEIILPPISSIGSGEGGEENINRNRNIDYNNLIVRNQSTGTGIDSDPNIIRIANFDERKELTQKKKENFFLLDLSNFQSIFIEIFFIGLLLLFLNIGKIFRF